ncbi:MAG: ATP-dependent sacrificial sulfur transferase LarE [Christensenellaceae bacterium]|jgi:uncharacterized protein
MQLSDFFAKYNKVALGFSGGVDSSYLLYAAKKYGAEIQPYFVKTAFQPQFELDDANKLAAQLTIPLRVISLDVFSKPEVIKNTSMRCYHCKRAIFGALQAAAKADGYTILIDGTNASDDADDRPGMRALQELEVLSPLRLCGITKDMVRKSSKEAGLFTWNKPAYACLATRIPTDTPITKAALTRIEHAEDFLSSLGFSDFRVRLQENTAKLQFPENQMARAFLLRHEISEKLQVDFDAIVMDFKTR